MKDVRESIPCGLYPAQLHIVSGLGEMHIDSQTALRSGVFP